MDWVSEVVTEFFARPPQWLEKLTPLVSLLMGAIIILLMAYSCAAAH